MANVAVTRGDLDGALDLYRQSLDIKERLGDAQGKAATLVMMGQGQATRSDFVGALKFLIGHDSISGPVNIASPNPLPNREFMRIFRDSWGTKIGLPASKLMLEIGAIFMRTETELILQSRRVVPRRLLDAGFEFEFADWRDACRDLCERFRARSKR